MSAPCYSVTLHVQVHDPKALYAAAVTMAEADNFDGIEATFGTRDEPDIRECLRMVIDPGVSPPGVQIMDSDVEGAA